MDLQLEEASSLALIDRQLGKCQLAPAEREIVRQVIYKTADFEYAATIELTKDALVKAVFALNNKTSIVVDVPEIQVSIVPQLRETFVNSVYCCQTKVTEPQPGKSKSALGLETLAKAHKHSIYIIGQEQTALATLIALTQKKVIQPALVILTAPLFSQEAQKTWLKESGLPSIYFQTNKGNGIVGATIFNTIVSLAWRTKNLTVDPARDRTID